jgi:hypothetical protein
MATSAGTVSFHRCKDTLMMMMMMPTIEQLRAALLGLAERHPLGDPFPCFCVGSMPGIYQAHDVWCEDARAALVAAADVLGDGVAPRPLVDA